MALFFHAALSVPPSSFSTSTPHSHATYSNYTHTMTAHTTVWRGSPKRPHPLFVAASPAAALPSSASAFTHSALCRRCPPPRHLHPHPCKVAACASSDDNTDDTNLPSQPSSDDSSGIPSALPEPPLTSAYSAAESIAPSRATGNEGEGVDNSSISSAVSCAATLTDALTEAASRSLAQLSPGRPPDLAVVHVSSRYAASNSVGVSGRHSIDLVVPRLRGLLPSLTHILGCTVDGVIGDDGEGDGTVEVEHAPALSVTLLRLPGVRITPFHILADDLPSPDDLQDRWHSAIYGANYRSKAAVIADTRAFLIFSDPATASKGDLHRVLAGLDYAFPSAVVTGGLASAATTFANGHMICTLPKDVLNLHAATGLHDSGIVGVALSGDLELDCLVSQGCRRIGGVEFEVKQIDDDSLSRTSASGSTNITRLRVCNRPNSYVKPATEELKAIIEYATPNEKRLLQDHLYVGVLGDSDADGNEDVVIKNVINVDFVGGVLTINANDIRIGQRIAFYVLDTDTMLHNLDASAQRYKRVELANSLVGYSNPPFGALVLADIARTRGAQFIPEQNMETRQLAAVAKGLGIGGAFTAGQIAPAGNPAMERNSPESRSVLHTAANVVVFWRRRSGMNASTSSTESSDEMGDGKNAPSS